MLAGVTASLAILTKPVALPAVLPIFAAATISDFRGWRPACASAAWFIGGALARWRRSVSGSSSNDALDDLYRDVFTFNTSYVGSSYTDQWRHLLAFGPIVGPLTFIALSGAFVRPSGARGFLKVHHLFLVWVAATVLATKLASPYPAGHYFIPVMPGVAILGVSGVSSGLARSSENERAHPMGRSACGRSDDSGGHVVALKRKLDFYFRKSVEQKIAFEFAEQGPGAFWRLNQSRSMSIP